MGVKAGWGGAAGACPTFPGPQDPRGDARRPPVPCHCSSCSNLPVPAARLGFQGLQIKSGAALLLSGSAGRAGQAAAPQLPAGRPASWLSTGVSMPRAWGRIPPGSQLVSLPSQCWEDAGCIPGRDAVFFLTIPVRISIENVIKKRYFETLFVVWART